MSSDYAHMKSLKQEEKSTVTIREEERENEALNLCIASWGANGKTNEIMQNGSREGMQMAKKMSEEIVKALYGSKKRRLPVFHDICPSE